MPAKTDFIQLNMPDGAVEYLLPGELLWFRKAFDSEWKGTTMIRASTGRLYSIDPIETVQTKFLEKKSELAKFNPPEGKLVMHVNAAQIREVETGNPILFHDSARSVLVFGPKLRLAVRQTVGESVQLIKAATGQDLTP